MPKVQLGKSGNFFNVKDDCPHETLFIVKSGAYKYAICKICGKVIDNSKRTIQKRTKFCSIECVENNREEKRLRRLK